MVVSRQISSKSLEIIDINGGNSQHAMFDSQRVWWVYARNHHQFLEIQGSSDVSWFLLGRFGYVFSYGQKTCRYSPKMAIYGAEHDNEFNEYPLVN